jgi:4-amino-4-deoxy-L-arabinose transferase-like glycosyltransferase
MDQRLTGSSGIVEMQGVFASENRKARVGIYTTIVFLTALVCYLPLPAGALLAGTEGHRALAAHQMVATGHWLVPRLYGRIYLRKPALHYWLQASMETLVGHGSPFVWRLVSSLMAASLAAVLCLMGSRWFGEVGGFVSGLSSVALFTLWSENRGADIDASNTFFSTIAALSLIELHLGRTSDMRASARRGWTFLAGLAIAGTMLVKLHAGMTIVLGAWLSAAIGASVSGRPRWLFRWSTWLPFAIGIAIFLVYAGATYAYLKSHSLALDFSGLEEASNGTRPHGWEPGYRLGWLLLAPTMFVYALPVSLALPMAFMRSFTPERRAAARVRKALATSVLIAWGICVIAGVRNPRYAYVTLPTICPLAGAVASVVPRLTGKMDRRMRWLVASCATTLSVFGCTLCVGTWRQESTQAVSLTAAVLGAVICAIFAIALLRGRTWRFAFGFVPLLLLVSANFSAVFLFDRGTRSSAAQGRWIAKMAGDDATLMACQAVQREPELFYYSGLPTIGVDGNAFDWRQVDRNCWVVLEPQEMEQWQREVPNRLTRVFPFEANRNPAYLVRYQLP